LTRWRAATICFVGAISLIAVLASSAAVARDSLSLAERLWHLHLAQLPAPALSVNDNPNLRTRTFRVQPATF